MSHLLTCTRYNQGWIGLILLILVVITAVFAAIFVLFVLPEVHKTSIQATVYDGVRVTRNDTYMQVISEYRIINGEWPDNIEALKQIMKDYQRSGVTEALPEPRFPVKHITINKGSIIITFTGHKEINNKSIALVPTWDNKDITWTCRAIDLDKKYLHPKCPYLK